RGRDQRGRPGRRRRPAHGLPRTRSLGDAGTGLRRTPRAPPPLPFRAMSLVTISGASKAFGAQHLFGDVSLRIAAGRRIAIIGPNGAGKTTLLEIITGE